MGEGVGVEGLWWNSEERVVGLLQGESDVGGRDSGDGKRLL